jgi:hypothetical protein
MTYYQNIINLNNKNKNMTNLFTSGQNTALTSQIRSSLSPIDISNPIN